jgi:predicted DNA-binding protein (MmcQ/YjbR family)
VTQEQIRKFCKTLPGCTEDIKWEHDSCFLIGEKMFCVIPTDGELHISLKATPEKFEELMHRSGIKPAQYLARYEWISIRDVSSVSLEELKHLIKMSYELIKAKLPSKVRKSI